MNPYAFLFSRTLLVGVSCALLVGGCAFTAKKEPPPEALAMPAPNVQDSDGDGVPDGADECPNTRPGVEVDARGCEIIGKLENTHFEFDSAVLTEQAKVVLNRIAALLMAVPDQKFDVAGHTDALGSDEYNRRLGERRAISVTEYLIRMGVAPAQLNVLTYGESQPVADNESEQGRAKNRRVEIVTRPQ